MKTLVRLVVGLCATLSVACMVTLSLSRAEADGRLPFVLAACEKAGPGRPCLMGQTAGHSRWDDALVALAQYTNDPTRATRRIIIPLGERGEVILFPSVDKVSVGRMQFTVPHTMALSAGWVVEHYGTPCGVSIYHDPKTLTLRYPHLLANVRLSQMYANPNYIHLDINARVINILYNDPWFASAVVDDPCVDNVTDWRVSNRGWQGFASVGHYVAYRR